MYFIFIPWQFLTRSLKSVFQLSFRNDLKTLQRHRLSPDFHVTVTQCLWVPPRFIPTLLNIIIGSRRQQMFRFIDMFVNFLARFSSWISLFNFGSFFTFQVALFRTKSLQWAVSGYNSQFGVRFPESILFIFEYYFSWILNCWVDSSLILYFEVASALLLRSQLPVSLVGNLYFLASWIQELFCLWHTESSIWCVAMCVLLSVSYSGPNLFSKLEDSWFS